jgi:hypothetical protein
MWCEKRPETVRPKAAPKGTVAGAIRASVPKEPLSGEVLGRHR